VTGPVLPLVPGLLAGADDIPRFGALGLLAALRVPVTVEA
jgi:hypothetical protein